MDNYILSSICQYLQNCVDGQVSIVTSTDKIIIPKVLFNVFFDKRLENDSVKLVNENITKDRLQNFLNNILGRYVLGRSKTDIIAYADFIYVCGELQIKDIHIDNIVKTLTNLDNPYSTIFADILIICIEYPVRNTLIEKICESLMIAFINRSKEYNYSVSFHHRIFFDPIYIKIISANIPSNKLNTIEIINYLKRTIDLVKCPTSVINDWLSYLPVSRLNKSMITKLFNHFSKYGHNLDKKNYLYEKSSIITYEKLLILEENIDEYLYISTKINTIGLRIYIYETHLMLYANNYVTGNKALTCDFNINNMPITELKLVSWDHSYSYYRYDFKEGPTKIKLVFSNILIRNK